MVVQFNGRAWWPGDQPSVVLLCAVKELPRSFDQTVESVPLRPPCQAERSPDEETVVRTLVIAAATVL
jgi:hypothetical protein